MTIFNTDLKLFASEKMTDSDDGGGKITGNVIISGQENNIFPDISRLDRTYGNVRLRKTFAAVDSQNDDLYAGAHVILTETPADPAVSVTLFTTYDWDDYRADLRDYMERYLALGGKWNGHLQETQLAGQKALLVWQRPPIPLPAIGAVWALVQNEGLSTEFSQYVRIVRVTDVLVTYYDDKGPYIVRQLTVEISDALLFAFTGLAPRRTDEGSPPAVIRNTIAADAARYYGMQYLAESASLGQMHVRAESLYQALVPSAQNEVAAVDLTAAGELVTLVTCGGVATFTTAATIGSGLGLYLGSACTHGSLSITVSGGALTDSGGDVLLGGTAVGSIDYSNGLLAFTSTCPTFAGTKTVSFRPAGVIGAVSDTAAIAIAPENRGYVYVITLAPIPAPGTLAIDYLSQGKWYRLQDNGTGACTGLDSAYGSAQLSYVTGSVMLTCGAMPDNGSQILFAWGTAVSTFDRSALTPTAPTIDFVLAHPGVAPGTYTVTWPTGQSLSDNGSGVLTGSGGTGTINYVTGAVSIRPNLLPLGGAEFSSSYQYGPPLSQTFAHPLREGDGTLQIALASTDLIPHSIELEWNLLVADYEAALSQTVEFIPNGSGTVWFDPIKIVRDNGSGGLPISGGVAGGVNYATGVLSFLPDVTISLPKASYQQVPIGQSTTRLAGADQVITTYRTLFSGWQYIPAGAIYPNDESGYVTVRYRASSSATTISGEIFTLSGGLTLDLTTAYNEYCVPASARFTLGGLSYLERNDGLYHTLNAATGAATAAGTLNRITGVATITDWTPGASNTLALTALLTRLNGASVDEVTFRTPGSPLRPGSVSVRANQLDGTLISATAGTDGVILTSAMTGNVDVQTGVVRVRFGAWVTAAGNEAEDWYWADAIREDGKIFHPVPVDPTTIRYNCVVYTYLPLSAAILGLDPVRLPMDGRVPVFQQGDVVVIHQTETKTCPNPLSAGQTVDCERVRLGRVEVRDSLDAVVDPAKYAADLDAGTVTFADPLVLTAYTQPLAILHTIEDMALAVSVEITGQINLNRPLSHAFPTPGSAVSSALLLGDLSAHVGVLFSQGSWTGVWSDARIGSAIIPQYNSAQYPVLVENGSCIQQRWALIFTSTTAFRVVGETLGQIATGSINETLAPVNPNTGRPYFTLNLLGWGGGWATGNVLRYPTVAANFPIDIARTILQSADSTASDRFALAIRGDIDRT